MREGLYGKSGRRMTSEDQCCRSHARMFGRMPVGVHGRLLSGGRAAACLAAVSGSSLLRMLLMRCFEYTLPLDG
jgi:hypothetical protein